jgi:hypothetical protein
MLPVQPVAKELMMRILALGALALGACRRWRSACANLRHRLSGVPEGVRPGDLLRVPLHDDGTMPSIGIRPFGAMLCQSLSRQRGATGPLSPASPGLLRTQTGV